MIKNYVDWTPLYARDATGEHRGFAILFPADQRVFRFFVSQRWWSARAFAGAIMAFLPHAPSGICERRLCRATQVRLILPKFIQLSVYE